MNILYVAHRIPYPPNKGDKIRSFHQIQNLSREHNVHLVCLADEKEDLHYGEALREHCVSVDVVYRSRRVAKCLAGLGLLSGRSLSVAAFYSRKLEEKIVHKLGAQAFDRILVFSGAMAQYVSSVSEIPKVIDFVDADSEKWRLYAEHHLFPLSWIYQVEADRLGRYEDEVARVFDHSIFVSQKEAEILKRRVGKRSISVIPNGIDLEYFAANGNDRSWMNHPIITFTGVMDYFPNVDAVSYFCDAILPLVRILSPSVKFYIVGRKPTRSVRKLGRQRGVVVTGCVPDVRPYLAKATLAVAPLRIARGIQNKVLEAMAMGLPVVGTPQAFQGLQATLADGIRIANDPKEFAREVVALLTDPRLRSECSLKARRYVECHHRWEDHGTRLEALLQAAGGAGTDLDPRQDRGVDDAARADRAPHRKKGFGEEWKRSRR